MAEARRKISRSKPRVEDTEPSSRPNPRKVPKGKLTPLENGQVRVANSMSELVPVAQYANVVLGPVSLEWTLSDLDMEALIDVDWESDENLTPEQQAVFDRAVGALSATSKVLEQVLAQDREIVEESVRLHNEREAREAAEDQAAAKKRKPARR